MRAMLKVACVIGLGGMMCTSPGTAAPLAGWQGRYLWDESLGRIGGSTPAEGAAAFVAYRLTVGRGGGVTGCQLDVEGFQTFRHIRCTVTPRGDSVIVKYYGQAPGARAEPYRRGTALFTLTRAKGGIMTRLQALTPVGGATPRGGRLFHRAG